MRRDIGSVCVVVFALLVVTSGAEASCGLKGCTMADHYNNTSHDTTASHQNKYAGSLETSGFFGSTPYGNGNASYFVSSFFASITPVSWFRASVNIPYTVASLPTGDVSGLSDVVVDASVSPWRSETMRLIFWTGLQTELPSGDDTKNLGAGHLGFLPYATLFFHVENVMAYLQTGYRFNLEGEHHDEAMQPSFDGAIQDPHSSREVVYRTGMIYSMTADLNTELGFNGQTVVDSHDGGDTFLGVIPQVTYRINHALVANAHIDLPLLNNDRYEWRSSVGISWMI